VGDQHKSTRPYLKNKLKAKGIEGMAQVVECYPSKCEALNAISSTTKINKKKNRDKKGRGYN
jgi:uncharacterized protein YegP (UPF0339 family)